MSPDLARIGATVAGRPAPRMSPKEAPSANGTACVFAAAWPMGLGGGRGVPKPPRGSRGARSGAGPYRGAGTRLSVPLAEVPLSRATKFRPWSASEVYPQTGRGAGAAARAPAPVEPWPGRPSAGGSTAVRGSSSRAGSAHTSGSTPAALSTAVPTPSTASPTGRARYRTVSRVVLTTDRAPATATDVAVSVETEVVAEVGGGGGDGDVGAGRGGPGSRSGGSGRRSEAALGLACVSAAGAPDGPAAGT